MDERDLIGAVLKEINYLWGLRNNTTREVNRLFEDPSAVEVQGFREEFEKNVLARQQGNRDKTHPTKPVPFRDRLEELRTLRTDLECDCCLGVGVMPDGGMCTVCEGTGIDLAKRVASPFTSWSRSRPADT